jgi:hypothetical protein
MRVVRTVWASQNYSYSNHGKTMMNKAQHAGWLEDLVSRANSVQRSCAGLDERAAFKVIKATVDDSDVVYGVFPDLAEPSGVGVVIIKGVNLLREVIASGKEISISTAAIPCIEREQALAAAQVWGDKTH